MGMDSKVFKLAAGCRPDILRSLEAKFYFPRLERPGIVYIDAPGWLQFRTSSFLVGYARVTGDLVNQFQSKLMAYLEEESVSGIIFCFDIDTPAPKALQRHSDGKLKIPQTPTSIENPTMEQGMAAWAEKMRTDIVAFHDSSAERILDPSLPVSQQELNYQLPRGSKEIEEEAKVNPAVAEEFSYDGCMRNKHFKRLLYDIVLRHLLVNLMIPPKKWVLACGPKHARLHDSTGAQPPKPELIPNGQEADSLVAYYASLFHDFDFVVDGPDGDIANTLLLSSWTRMQPSNGELRFLNNVYVLRNQWQPRYPNSLLNINELFMLYNNIGSTMQEKHAVRWTNPVVLWTMVNLLVAGSDYIDKRMLPDIGLETAYKALIAHSRAFAEHLCGGHISADLTYHYIVLNPDAFSHFYIACYKERVDATLSWNLEEALAQLRAKKSAKLASLPTAEQVYVLCANLSWVLSYSSAYGYGCAPPDPFEMRNGLSVWGFVKNERVERAERVNVQYLRHRSRNLTEEPAVPLTYRV
jgi:hypothetical protein